jgi:LCP family protein required for cell wall assembly
MSESNAKQAGKRSKRTLLIVLAVIALAAIITGIVLASVWNRPMGVGLGLPTSTATSLPSPVPTIKAIEAEATAAASPTPLPSPTAPQPVCGKVPVMYVLVVGAYDGAQDTKYLYGLADVVRVVRVDFMEPSVQVLTLPRDLYVRFPDIREDKAEQVQWGKLNQAYFFGNPGKNYYTGAGEGPGLLARTIQENFGLSVDHYGAINMLVFTDLIDDIGGIDVYLPNDVDGRPIGEESTSPELSHGYFFAGWNHMSGYDAESFVRIRDRYSDMQRGVHQSWVICAVKNKLQEPAVWTNLLKIIQTVLERSQTDFTVGQLFDLGTCMLPKLKAEDIQFFSLPVATQKEVDYKNPPSDKLYPASDMVAELNNGFPAMSYVLKYDSDWIRAFIDAFEAGTLEPQPSSGDGGCPEWPPRDTKP